jgi:hypothetical protein
MLILPVIWPYLKWNVDCNVDAYATGVYYYNWPPHTNQFCLAVLCPVNFLSLIIKPSYLTEGIICTKFSVLASIPCPKYDTKRVGAHNKSNLLVKSFCKNVYIYFFVSHAAQSCPNLFFLYCRTTHWPLIPHFAYTAQAAHVVQSCANIFFLLP